MCQKILGVLLCWFCTILIFPSIYPLIYSQYVIHAICTHIPLTPHFTVLINYVTGFPIKI